MKNLAILKGVYKFKNENVLQLWSIWWPSSLQQNNDFFKKIQVLCLDNASTKRIRSNDKLDSITGVSET